MALAPPRGQGTAHLKQTKISGEAACRRRFGVDGHAVRIRARCRSDVGHMQVIRGLDTGYARAAADRSGIRLIDLKRAVLGLAAL